MKRQIIQESNLAKQNWESQIPELETSTKLNTREKYLFYYLAAYIIIRSTKFINSLTSLSVIKTQSPQVMRMEMAQHKRNYCSMSSIRFYLGYPKVI